MYLYRFQFELEREIGGMACWIQIQLADVLAQGSKLNESTTTSHEFRQFTSLPAITHSINAAIIHSFQFISFAVMKST